MAELVRTNGGATVHRIECDVKGTRAAPWLWAQSKSIAEVAATSAQLGVKPCGTCHPYAAAPRTDRFNEGGRP